MIELPFAPAAGATLEWLLTYLLHSTLILGATTLLCKHVALPVALRDLLWKAALPGGALTATLQTVSGLSPLTGAWSVAGGAERLTDWLAPAGQVATPAAASGAASLVAPVLVGCWLAVAAFNLLRLARSHLRFRTLIDRHPLHDPVLLAEARELQSALALPFAVRFSVSRAYPSPLALGRGEVCVPEWFASLLPLERRSTLVHELAHLARRDPLWQTVALVAARLLFFQPLNELARRRMAEVAEYACDDWAVSRTGSALGMLRALAAVAERCAGAAPAPFGGNAMAGDLSPLMARAERLARGHHEPPRRTTWTEAALAGAFLFAVALTAPACSFPGAPGLPEPRAAAPLPEQLMLVRFRPSTGAVPSPPGADAAPPAMFYARPGDTDPPPREVSPARARELMKVLGDLRRTGRGDAQLLVRIGTRCAGKLLPHLPRADSEPPRRRIEGVRPSLRRSTTICNTTICSR